MFEWGIHRGMDKGAASTFEERPFVLVRAMF